MRTATSMPSLDLLKHDDMAQPKVAVCMGPFTKRYVQHVKNAIHLSMRKTNPLAEEMTQAILDGANQVLLVRDFRFLVEDVTEGVCFLHLVIAFHPNTTEAGLKVYEEGMVQIASLALEAYRHGSIFDPDAPSLEAYCAEHYAELAHRPLRDRHRD